ncbi:PR domain zinc finger protein 10-like [Paramacrobiotus metropolitanus]|uniref:PR domain zinc finger protein 10-like n=1 Tax=Paramacrobiotus metropolitanus TaxID=2943436 RepID=UPI002445E286|nr:PR domain zinc finger protein 10-like [Paramacrobiotus metropolitanus]XP_055331783.1 PR domain zinc finger protein 10-like [Paramacrobiotus metropolitanus]
MEEILKEQEVVSYNVNSRQEMLNVLLEADVSGETLSAKTTAEEILTTAQAADELQKKSPPDTENGADLSENLSDDNASNIQIHAQANGTDTGSQVTKKQTAAKRKLASGPNGQGYSLEVWKEIISFWKDTKSKRPRSFSSVLKSYQRVGTYATLQRWHRKIAALEKATHHATECGNLGLEHDSNESVSHLVVDGRTCETAHRAESDSDLQQLDIDLSLPGMSAEDDGKRFLCTGIYCAQCQRFSEEPCWFHTSYIENTPVVPLAIASLPGCLTIDLCMDSLEKGVFTRTELHTQTVFGPMLAPVCIASEEANFGIKDENGSGVVKQCLLDSDDYCNWMRYVRLAKNLSEQNLMVCQRKNKLVFVTTKYIAPGEELRVGYSRPYARMIDSFHSDFSVFDIPDASSAAMPAFSGIGLAQMISQERPLDPEVTTHPRRTNRSRLPVKPNALTPVLKPALCSSLPENLVSDEDSVQSEEAESEDDDAEIEEAGSDSDYYPTPPPSPKHHVRKVCLTDPSEATKFACSDCKINFGDEKLLSLHNSLHADGAMDGPERECPECRKTFGMFGDLVFHVKSHGKRYHPRTECEHCGIFIASIAMDTHVKYRHPEVHSEQPETGSWACHICEREFNTKASLTLHQTTHDRAQCAICNLVLANAAALGRHAPVHKEVDGYRCPVCEKVFATYGKMSTHHRGVHKEPDAACTICNKTFRDRSKLQVHMRTHEKTYEFVCDTCGKAFNQKKELDGHRRRMHDAAGRKVCRLRYQEARSRGQIQGYVNPRKRMAYEEFPYKCELCRKGFLFEGKLNRHRERYHSDTGLQTIIPG